MPGSPRDGQIDERVLVRQPVCPTHRSAGQENRLTALCHQGNERLSLSFCTGAGRGAHRCMKVWGRGCVCEGALCWTHLQAVFGAKVLSRFFRLQLLWTWTLQDIIKEKKFKIWAIRSKNVYVMIFCLPHLSAHCFMLHIVVFLCHIW